MGGRDRGREMEEAIFFVLMFCFSFLVPGFVFLFARMAPLPFLFVNLVPGRFLLGRAHSGGFFLFSGLCFFFVDQSPFSIFFCYKKIIIIVITKKSNKRKKKIIIM